MADVSWSLPDPNSVEFNFVKGDTVGSALSDALAPVSEGMGPVAQTEGAALSTAVAPVAESAEGPLTQGDAQALSPAPVVVGEEGPTTEGNIIAPTRALSVEGHEGSKTEGEIQAPTIWTPTQGQHLKPTRRWQMPLPRNLLSDPESFDPGSTGWESSQSTYAGTVDNVGPNGEAAHRFDIGTSGNWAVIAKDGTLDLPSYQPLTVGFLVRAVNVDLGLQVRFKNQDFSESSVGSTTVTTDWQWVVGTNPNGGARFVRLETQYDTSFNESLYILRAGLNRGSSLQYSTRSQVPQTIPDVVQGADLQNGSTTGADTNDLDFGVDADGVPYAVSDGDDFTGDVPSNVVGAGTWVGRFYVPSSPSGVARYMGDFSGRADLRFRGNTKNWKLAVNRNAVLSVNGTVGWNTVALTLDGEYARLNANGNVDETNNYTEDTTDPFPIFRGEAGSRAGLIEQHPVLSEAEAEAVRQRLATNPPDPVAPTEAWDFTAETNPHNLLTQSEDIFGGDWTTRRINEVQDPIPVPSPLSTVWGIKETSIDKNHEWQREVGVEAGATYTWVAFAKAGGRPVLKNTIFSSNSGVANFDLENNTIKSVSNGNAYITDIGNGWRKCAFQWTAGTTETVTSRWEVKKADGSNFVGDGTIGLYFSGAQFTRGEEVFPPYIPTTDSIAFPQTVPSLTGRNDLTLGSTSGADTNDPDWVAPRGIWSGDGDDKLPAPDVMKHKQSFTINYAMRSGGNGEFRYPQGLARLTHAGNEYLIKLHDESGNNVNIFKKHSDVGIGNPADGNVHAVTLRYDAVAGTWSAFIDDMQIGSIDTNSLGTISTSQFSSLLRKNASNYLEVLHFYTRALTDEEALYARQRILDNPEQPYPNYTTP